MAGPRVTIVGAGAVGLACADHLLAAGVSDVVVLEQEQVASGSSGLNIGVVETQYMDPLWIALRVYARRVFDRLADERGLEFVRCGYLRPAGDDAAMARYARSVELQRELGVPDARVVDGDEIGVLFPDLRRDDLVGGLFGPSDGYVDPHRYCGLLADSVRAAGGEIRTGTALLGADRTPAGFTLRTTSGDIAADVVVNAAGAWAPRVGALLGAPVGVVPQRRQAAIAHLARPLAYVPPFFMHYEPGTGRLGAYIRYERPDQLVVGLHTEDILDAPADPDAYPRGNSQEFLEDLAEQLVDRLPALGDGIRLGNGWSGLYPMGPGGQPRVGPRPDAPGVIEAVGFGGSGLQASPAAGLLVAEWIVAGEPTTIPAATAIAPPA